MITDQKTQNRLHADTGTELFSIRQRKEAVTRMLDILKETPEYLQVMNHIPAYAMDDDTSEWWKSEESENFMNSLLVNPEKPDVPLNKNDAFQKVQKRHVQEKR